MLALCSHCRAELPLCILFLLRDVPSMSLCLVSSSRGGGARQAQPRDPRDSTALWIPLVWGWENNASALQAPGCGRSQAEEVLWTASQSCHHGIMPGSLGAEGNLVHV